MDGEIKEAEDGGFPGLNWFEDAIWRIDDVLEDVIMAVRPGILPANAKQRFLRNVSEGAKRVKVTKKGCPELNCEDAPAPICPSAAR